MQKFKFIHVPGLVPTTNAALNLGTNVISGTRISDHSSAIVWIAVQDAYLVNMLELGEITLSEFDNRMTEARNIWKHFKLTKEFQHVLHTYENSSSVLGAIKPGSSISLEWNYQQTNLTCTGFKIIFEDEGKGTTIVRYDLDISNGDELAHVLQEAIKTAEQAAEKSHAVA
jgi:hypothetical protein